MLRDRARTLRAAMTEPERILWAQLRQRTLGARFRRQVPLGRYVVDFACFAPRIVVEVDGGQHLEAEAADAARDAWLRSQGYRVLRFWNHEVLGDLDAVVDAILAEIGGSTPHPDPPPQGGREER